MRIALLEDDKYLGALVQLWLTNAGHSCEHFLSGEALLETLAKQDFDMAVIDWMLPGISGDAVLQWIRQNKGWDMQIMFVTSRYQEDDIVNALENGADDYMVKPVNERELLARVAALGRRVNKESKSEIADISPFEIDEKSHTLLLRGEIIQLTQKEFELSHYLFSNVGQIISRSDLLSNVWDRSADLNTRTVDIHMSRLRKKLGLNGESGWQLAGIYNHGYRLERAYTKTEAEMDSQSQAG